MKRINNNFIAVRRGELSYTLKEMAEKLGFRNASTYYKYERGETDFKANQLPLLAEKLQCQIEDFFFDPNLLK